MVLDISEAGMVLGPLQRAPPLAPTRYNVAGGRRGHNARYNVKRQSATSRRQKWASQLTGGEIAPAFVRFRGAAAN